MEGEVSSAITLVHFHDNLSVYIIVFWDVTPCRLIRVTIVTKKLLPLSVPSKAVRFFEVAVTDHQTTRRHV